MKKKNRFIAKVLIFVMLFQVIACMPAAGGDVQAVSAVPVINAKVSKNNVLKILNRYDKDGAYILKKQIAKGDNVMRWFSGGTAIADRVSTAVHEETHAYSYSYRKKKGMAYFVGKKKTVYVPRTKVYRTKKMAKSIPGNLRTFRYNTYVARPAKYLSSNVDGAYGLLNEFMAYRTGMNTSVSLFPYYAGQDADWNAWSGYIMECENGKLAYAEFKYYILHYLSYAKKHYPKVYKGMVNNRQFCTAYRKIESGYAKLIRQYEKDLKNMQSLMAKKGYQIEIADDTVWIHYAGYGTGVSRYSADYQKLQAELSKGKYKAIHKKLVR